MVSRIFWMLLLLGGFSCECLREILMARDTYLDPGVGQILTTTDIPFTFSFSRLRGERVERDEYVLAREVEASFVI